MTFLHDHSPVIVDASVAVDALIDPDDSAFLAWSSWQDDGRLRLVPPAFWLEVANALLRSRRLPLMAADDLLGRLAQTELEVADRGSDGVRAAMALADRHGLTVYDAAYLWLAIDVDGELATRDAALIRAAEAEGVPLADV